MELVHGIRQAVQTILAEKYNYRLDSEEIMINETKPEFTGDYTVVLFSFSKILKISPDILGRELGASLLAAKPGRFAGFNVIKGFLNLEMADGILIEFLHAQFRNADYGKKLAHGGRVMV